MNGARLTQTATGLDLKRENGRVPRATDGTETAQHGSVRLQKFVGESVTDNENEDFTRWYEVIWHQQKSKAEKELEIKRRILGTAGVVRILDFSWSQNADVVNIIGQVQTEWGVESISESINLL